MIIAVDFDGTIVEHRYPSIGKEIPFAIETLKKLKELVDMGVLTEAEFNAKKKEIMGL